MPDPTSSAHLRSCGRMGRGCECVATAYHEAGHAVVGTLLGVLGGNVVTLGHDADPPVMLRVPRDLGELRESLRARALTAAAGGIAQFMAVQSQNYINVKLIKHTKLKFLNVLISFGSVYKILRLHLTCQLRWLRLSL